MVRVEGNGIEERCPELQQAWKLLHVKPWLLVGGSAQDNEVGCEQALREFRSKRSAGRRGGVTKTTDLIDELAQEDKWEDVRHAGDGCER